MMPTFTEILLLTKIFVFSRIVLSLRETFSKVPIIRGRFREYSKILNEN